MNSHRGTQIACNACLEDPTASREVADALAMKVAALLPGAPERWCLARQSAVVLRTRAPWKTYCETRRTLRGV